MKSYLVLILEILLIQSLGIAQVTECDALIPPNVTVEQSQSGNLSLYRRTTEINLRLAIHIVRYSSGFGGIPQTDLNQKIEYLNNIMNQVHFHFYIYSTDYIDSDEFAEITGEIEPDELRQINVVDNCINVYCVPYASFNGTSSFSPRIQDPNFMKVWGKYGTK